jgi:hypothetical protein
MHRRKFLAHLGLFLVVIRDFHFVSVAFLPFKTNPPLIVDANAVLTGTFASKFLQSIARRDTEIVQAFSGVENCQFSPHSLMQIGRKATRRLTLKQLLGFFVPEGSDHTLI